MKSLTGPQSRLTIGRGARLALPVAAALLLAACQAGDFAVEPKHLRPLSYAAQERLQDLGMNKTAPIMMRIYKQESELEIWKEGASGRYELFKSYEICRWSGELGPKYKEGDRQAPEGFYEVTPALMNPNSKYYLSFNLGFPNPFDQAHDRTGSHLMVHGACSSAGCYAMTDEQMQEIYSMAREAFRGGQESFQVQAFPFRMTPENFVKHRNNEHYAFWKMLKDGHDHFDAVGRPPKLDVCEGQYVFNGILDDEDDTFEARESCPAYTVPDGIATEVAKLQAEYESGVTAILDDIQARMERAEKWEQRGEAVANMLTFGGLGKSNEAPDPEAVSDEDAAANAEEAGEPVTAEPAATE
ncbi:MAG: murein L,D-transpeptidase family protein [Pseudomonadota bacterium]